MCTRRREIEDGFFDVGGWGGGGIEVTKRFV